ncbi:MAG TPA: dCTP deaminase [bacterium]|nr:dCTP deaminase [bacterium]HPJ72409.1 dCTP deaminase [bacterium]HPQ66364.1 dCTP deaminase [bacterium]
MSVIARSELKKLIREGVIRIEPLAASQIGPASVDLHISNRFWVYDKVRDIFHVDDAADYRKVSREVMVKDYFVLMPGESVMGITVEKITLPENICGRLEGRSRFARLGLLVHITASFMQPGISNHQILEMYNASPIPLAIHPGTRICQFVFEYTIGKGKYRGRYVRQ